MLKYLRIRYLMRRIFKDTKYPIIFILFATIILIKYLEFFIRLKPKKSNNKELFCWVLTNSNYHNTRVPSVNLTYINRCDYGIFFTDKPMNDKRVPHLPLFHDLPNHYLNSHNKTIRAFVHAYRNISNKFDWYYRVDDDTYLIVENLRKFLRNYDPNEPHFLGSWIYRYQKHFPTNGYNQGGGYVLSNKALQLLVEEIENNGCQEYSYEDVSIAKCLEKLKIYPESTAEKGQHRFLPFSFGEHFYNKFMLEHNRILTEPINKGFDLFHPELIGIHHTTPNEMLLIDTLLYRVNVEKNL